MFVADPNTHIIWINNANAKLKALRDVDPGKFLLCFVTGSRDVYIKST